MQTVLLYTTNIITTAVLGCAVGLMMRKCCDYIAYGREVCTCLHRCISLTLRSLLFVGYVLFEIFADCHKNFARTNKRFPTQQKKESYFNLAMVISVAAQ